MKNVLDGFLTVISMVGVVICGFTALAMILIAPVAVVWVVFSSLERIVWAIIGY